MITEQKCGKTTMVSYPHNKLALLFLLTPLLSCSYKASEHALPRNESRQTSETTGHEASTTTGLCRSDEIVYFSCSTSKAKNVSMCGSSFTNSPRDLTYRFGKIGKIELEYSANLDPGGATSRGFLKNSYFRNLVGYTEIAFENAGHEYRVFRRFSDEPGTKEDPQAPAREYGVEVSLVSTGNEIASIACDNVYVDDLKKLSNLLQCDTSSALGCAE